MTDVHTDRRRVRTPDAIECYVANGVRYYKMSDVASYLGGQAVTFHKWCTRGGCCLSDYARVKVKGKTKLYVRETALVYFLETNSSRRYADLKNWIIDHMWLPKPGNVEAEHITPLEKDTSVAEAITADLSADEDTCSELPETVCEEAAEPDVPAGIPDTEPEPSTVATKGDESMYMKKSYHPRKADYNSTLVISPDDLDNDEKMEEQASEEAAVKAAEEAVEEAAEKSAGAAIDAMFDLRQNTGALATLCSCRETCPKELFNFPTCPMPDDTCRCVDVDEDAWQKWLASGMKGIQAKVNFRVEIPVVVTMDVEVPLYIVSKQGADGEKYYIRFQSDAVAHMYECLRKIGTGYPRIDWDNMRTEKKPAPSSENDSDRE